MRLKKAHVTKYRSVRDSEWFEVEHKKTIFVGPNEAGKTALLQALQQIGPPDGVRKLDALRDYPRSEYNDITTGNVRPQDVTVAEAHFLLEDDDKAAIPAEFREATYVRGRKLDNSAWYNLEGGPPSTTYGSIKKDLTRLAAHADSNLKAPAEGQPAPVSPSTELDTITQGWLDGKVIKGDVATKVESWLKKVLTLVDEKNQDEENRHERLSYAIQLDAKRDLALKTLDQRMPVFVLFSNYFRVRPIIHLEHLAHRIETNVLDDKWYDYGNECLLRLLGFSARELSNLGKAPETG